MADKFDLIVIGAGPGGYPAAIRGAQLGFKVACVERERAGGICLNWGCIPTKALLKSADAMRTVQHAADFGVIVKGEIGFDWNKVIARSRAVSEKLAGGVDSLFRKYGVTQVKGTASLTGRGKVEVKTASGVQKLEAPRIAAGDPPGPAPITIKSNLSAMSEGCLPIFVHRREWTPLEYAGSGRTP